MSLSTVIIVKVNLLLKILFYLNPKIKTLSLLYEHSTVWDNDNSSKNIS